MRIDFTILERLERRADFAACLRACAHYLAACCASDTRELGIWTPRMIARTVARTHGPWVDPYEVGKRSRRLRWARLRPAGRRLFAGHYATRDVVCLPLPR